MRIIFMGTPQFAVPSLSAVATQHDIAAVITQPDKPGNRGAVVFSPVKKLALELGLPVYQFDKISKQGADVLRSLAPDAIITAAYGQILSREIIDIPRHGILNVHASLLPKYRGSSPIQWAIINGESETGVTIMKTAEGLDTGDMILKRSIPITNADDAETMFEKLSLLGAEAITDALALIDGGNAAPEKQNENDATYFPMLKKTDGLVDWNRPAREIFNNVRGMKSWPTAYTTYQGKAVKIFACRCVGGEFIPGTVAATGKELIVGCGEGAISITELQLEGKRRMNAADFCNGTRIKAGDILG